MGKTDFSLNLSTSNVPSGSKPNKVKTEHTCSYLLGSWYKVMGKLFCFELCYLLGGATEMFPDNKFLYSAYYYMIDRGGFKDILSFSVNKVESIVRYQLTSAFTCVNWLLFHLLISFIIIILLLIVWISWACSPCKQFKIE